MKSAVAASQNGVKPDEKKRTDEFRRMAVFGEGNPRMNFFGAGAPDSLFKKQGPVSETKR